jgi:hypothetical protein
MQLAFEDRLVPTRATSASREVVRSREYLDAARHSLELAIEIVGRSDIEPASVPISALDRVLGLLQEAEAALWEAAS